MRIPFKYTKELVIVTEHFSPSTGATAQLVTDLADDLHARGVNICILTSTCGQAEKPYRIVRLSTGVRATSGILLKAYLGILFILRVTLWLGTKLNKQSSLLLVSNPPFLGLVGPFIRIVKNVKYVFLLQDLFPKSACLSGLLPGRGPLVFFWRRLLSLVINQSSTTIVLSEDMRNRCLTEYQPTRNITTIPNWAVFNPCKIDKSDSILFRDWNIKHTLTLQYSGNFGRLHDILTILEAARLLVNYPVNIYFVGGGAKLEYIKHYVDKYNLTNVAVKPYQPRDLLPHSLAACDISLVSLINGAEDAVAPSKFYGIIASSRPVILISNPRSELSRLITSWNCGLVVSPGDVEQLVREIISLISNTSKLSTMSMNSGILYKSRFGRQHSTSQYYQLFKQLGFL